MTLLKAIKFSKKLIAFMFIIMIVFTIAMIVTFFITGSVPETLIQEFFGFFKIEGGALGGIKIADTIVEWSQKKKKEDEAEEKDKETNEDATGNSRAE